MAFEDNSLDEYIKKVLQIQQERQDNKLSPEDLLDIADRMGINAEDIVSALDAYIKRGEGYIKYQNWQDAKEEFEQARILSPQNPDILYNLALAEAGLFKDTGDENCRKRAIEYAQESLEFEPNNEKAFKLVSELKKEVKKPSYTYSKVDPQIPVIKKKSRGRRILIVLAIVLGIGSFVAIRKSVKKNYNFSYNIKDVIGNQKYSFPNKSTFDNFASFYAKNGPVVWIIYYKQEVRSGAIKRDHFIDIIDPVKNRLIKTLEIDKDSDYSKSLTWSNLSFDGTYAYAYNEGEAIFEKRDIYTGEVVLDNVGLEKKFEELKTGIGKIKKEDNGLMITTKLGEEYFYDPIENSIMERELMKQISSDYSQKKSWTYRYRWLNLRDGNKSKIVMERDLANPFQTDQNSFSDRDMKSYMDILNHKNQGTNSVDDNKTFRLDDRTYFNPMLLYSDSSACFFVHQSEVGKKSKAIFTYVNSEGKNLWEFTKTSSVLLNSLLESGTHQSVKFQNVLVISKKYIKVSKSESKNVVCAIDMNTGKVLWEFSFKQ